MTVLPEQKRQTCGDCKYWRASSWDRTRGLCWVEPGMWTPVANSDAPACLLFEVRQESQAVMEIMWLNRENKRLTDELKRLRESSGHLIYLASPYTHEDEAIRNYRYESARMVTVHLLRRGYHVWAPIVYTHHLATAGLPVEFAAWEQFDLMMLRRCQELWVLLLRDWRESRGVQAEIRAAREIGLPVQRFTWDEIWEMPEAKRGRRPRNVD